MSFRETAGVAVIVALAHAGCGDRGAGPSGVDERVSSRSVAPQEGAVAATLVVGSRRGTVEVTADWTIGRNNVDVYVTADNCFEIPTALSIWSCIAVAKAEGETARPERLAFPGAAGASYKVFVLNHGPEADTVTVTLSIR